MSLHIYYETKDAPWGGGNSFLKYFERHTTLTLADAASSNVILISGASRSAVTAEKIKFEDIAKFKQQGKKIVYRLDSLGQLSAGRSDMDDLQLRLAKLADGVIFQSEFCRECFADHGCKPSNWTTILNGTDLEIFQYTPQELIADRVKIICCSWSSNPRKGFQLMADFSRLPNVDMTFVGRWCEQVSMPKAVVTKPPLTHNELAQEYARSNFLLFPSRGEACPNTVIEALACGKPVLYHDSGGTTEIAHSFGIEIQNDLAATLQRATADYSRLCERIEEQRAFFDVKEKVKQYEQFIQEL